MKTTVIVGTQWGDEGKGRICDYLAGEADYIVRYQGGNNAGHTVVVGDRTFKLHLIPSGILHRGKVSIMADGTLVDPRVLADELDELQAQGIDTSGLRVSGAAHVIMPYHPVIDRLEEERRGSGKIGTTARGVGPAYADKAARIGIRVYDLLDPAGLRRRVADALEMKNVLFTQLYGAKPMDPDAVCDEVLAVVPKLAPYVADTRRMLVEAAKTDARVLLEGAQATFLDLDYGTYPNVTSSHPVAGGACLGTGVSPTALDEVIGVVKAYTTRVGSGPFPTELDDALGATLRERGQEYGTTTGRPRRCGWLDAVMVRTAACINGLTSLAVTKIDVLDQADPIRICVGYEARGEAVASVPSDVSVFEACTPVYEDVPGWCCDTSGVRRLAEIPAKTRAFLDRVGDLVGVPVRFASFGPERTQLVDLAP